MKMGLLQLLCIMALTLGLACSEKPVPPEDNEPLGPPRTVNQLTADELSAIEGFNEFGWNLFTQVYHDQDIDDNIFISPLSVSYAMGLAVNGARGDTRDSMIAALELHNMSLEDINVAYREVNRILAVADPAVKFTLANSFWSNRGVGIVSSYKDRCRDYFDSDVSELEFGDPSAASVINNWVKDKTANKITSIVPDPLPGEWVAVILNAIYFKGDWTYPFRVENTAPYTFNLASGGTATVDMMQRNYEDDLTDFKDRLRERPIGIFINHSAMGFNLPYGDNGFVMTVVLPAEGKTLDDLIPTLSAEQIHTWGAVTDSYYSRIYVPKFRFKWNSSLVDALKSIGFGIAFDGNRADFRDMFSSLDTYISEVTHASFVQVDEKGTEAAAATMMGFPTSSPPDFICDRPFLFIVQERTSGAILFIGKIGKPVWEN